VSWTYSGDPSTSTRDALRFLIQDTDSSAQVFSDEELDYLLTEQSDVPLQAAIQAAEIAISTYARKADRSVGDLSISYSQISSNYQKLLTVLRRRTAVETLAPYAGGISISDKQANLDDTDLVRPSAYRGMHDHDGPQTDTDWDSES
jgi:hypothetical protein